MIHHNNRDREIAKYVFSGSTTMVGVCVTVIALFRVMNMNIKTYADEILGYTTFIFIAATLLSYASLRREKNSGLEKWADILFFIGMFMMVIVGFIIVYAIY
jgi:hypothetical protein